MAAPQAFMTASSFLGVGVETTRNTAVAPAFYLPIESPQITPNVKWLADIGYRGSPIDNYGNVPGPRHDEYDVKGNVFLDTFPLLLRSMLGSTDVVATAPTATTLAALAAAGANSISTTATIAAGSVIAIGSGATLESHITGTPTGAGPFTIPLIQPLLNGQANGATVTGFTSHTIGVLNSPTVGNQPPSVTLVDFDGVTARQITGAQGDSLNITFGADAAFAWTGKWIGNANTSVGAPSNVYSTEIFVPGYSVQAAIGGAVLAQVVSGECDIKRSAEAIQTADSSVAPFVNWAGPLSVTGKLSFVVLTGDNTLTAGTSYLKQALNLLFAEPQTGHALKLQMSQVQYDSPKINRGKSYVQVDCNYTAEGNATDAVGGGYSPLVTQTGNAKTAAY
jgi:hypothetical protein